MDCGPAAGPPVRSPVFGWAVVGSDVVSVIDSRMRPTARAVKLWPMGAEDHATAGDETLRVADNPAERRYEAHLGDRLAGFAEYRLAPGRVIFFHTVVDPDLEGRGFGSQLARGALDDVRVRGLWVTPHCPFIRSYIRRHPEYADLVHPSAGPAIDGRR